MPKELELRVSLVDDDGNLTDYGCEMLEDDAKAIFDELVSLIEKRWAKIHECDED